MKAYIKFKLHNEIATLVCPRNTKSDKTVKTHSLEVIAICISFLKNLSVLHRLPYFGTRFLHF